MIKWIKWGDTPLVLLFLSPIPMFSFTFLIINGVGGIIPKLPRRNQVRFKCGEISLYVVRPVP